MSEQTLRSLMERINVDTTFRDQLIAAPGEALSSYQLSASEITAVAAGDEDALRRLCGGDTSGYNNQVANIHIPHTRLCTIIHSQGIFCHPSLLVHSCPPQTFPRTGTHGPCAVPC